MSSVEYIIPIVITVIFISSLYKIAKINKDKLKEYELSINESILDNFIEPVKYEKIPGILMSIGIIGTFILIFFGLSSIPDTLNILKVLEVIKEKIAPAFLVSAFGVFMSIFYIFLESFFLKNYRKKFENYKENNQSLTYVKIATQEIMVSKNILESIEKQTKTFESLSDFAEGLESMSESMEKFGRIADNLEDTLNPNKLGEVISSAFLKEMTPVLNNIQSITSNVDENSQKITRFLEEDLKNEIIEPLKEAVISTDKSMIEMREVLEKTSNVMNETSKGIEKISDNLSKLEKSQTEFVINLDNVLDKQKIEFENTTQIIEKTYTELNRSVSNQTEQFEKNSHIILKSFTTLSMEMKTFLEEYKEDYKVILEEQQKAIVETKDSAVEILDKSGKQASTLITEASVTLNLTLSNINETLVSTSEKAGKILDKSGQGVADVINIASNNLNSTLSNVNETLVSTSEKAGKILDKSGQGVADVINMASNNLNATLSGVDEALVKTSQSIKEELENFKNSYTESLKGFLDSQEEILNKVFKEQTERLAGVVDSFRSNLETDVNSRKLLNEDLEKLIKTTTGFVASTQAMITTAFDEQQSQLSSFLETNQTMQSKLKYIVDNASDINENGNVLTQELIITTGDLMKSFTKNQREVLEKYQKDVSTHLETILGAMLAIIEVSHTTKD